ncbi:MAG: TRAP transporter small permease [Deltaproteobacteria bacterium]|nr:TRAP transporter small permease [Deltaproteobacteria bacterium]
MIQKVLHFLERYFLRYMFVVKNIGLIILVAMMFLTIVDVFGRKFFAAPVTGSYEVTEFMLALFVFFSIAYTQHKKGHIAIEALFIKLSSKAQALLDCAVYLISMVLSLLMTWQLLVHAKRIYLGHTVTGVLHLPIYPFFIAAAVGTFFYFLVLAIDFLRSLEQARK